MVIYKKGQIVHNIVYWHYVLVWSYMEQHHWEIMGNSNMWLFDSPCYSWSHWWVLCFPTRVPCCGNLSCLWVISTKQVLMNIVDVKYILMTLSTSVASGRATEGHKQWWILFLPDRRFSYTAIHCSWPDSVFFLLWRGYFDFSVCISIKVAQNIWVFCPRSKNQQY